jgi:hypothetical protein
MRRLLVLLCIALNISFQLMPFSTMHMHESADHHVEMHGSHLHSHHASHDVDEDSHAPGDVVDMQTGASEAGFSAAHWVIWGIALCSVFLGFFVVPFIKPAPEPPRTLWFLSGKRSHWHPPLRGPPALSI